MQSEPQFYLVMGEFFGKKPVFGVFFELFGNSDRSNYVDERNYWQTRVLFVEMRILQAEIPLTILDNACVWVLPNHQKGFPDVFVVGTTVLVHS